MSRNRFADGRRTGANFSPRSVATTFYTYLQVTRSAENPQIEPHLVTRGGTGGRMKINGGRLMCCSMIRNGQSGGIVKWPASAASATAWLATDAKSYLSTMDK